MRNVGVHAHSGTLGGRGGNRVLLVRKNAAEVGHDHFSERDVDVAVAGVSVTSTRDGGELTRRGIGQGRRRWH